MCGVAGIFDLEGERVVDEAALRRMAAAIAHRGPDGEGFFSAPGIGLAHRRLAIIDLEGGAQPFRSADGDNVISYNGEIYNYRDLRRGFAEIEFRTQSDTEVLVEGLSRFGAGYIDRLRGMFAFAWWNARDRTLTLARDRFGEKPLYYAVSKDGFLVFASELAAIRASGLVELRHSAEAMRAYFHFGFVPDPLSIYENVLKLQPATHLAAQRGKPLSLAQYWRPEFSIDASLSFEAAQSGLLDRFDDAVNAQSKSDVSLGAFLSGGVDSASIVASLSRIAPCVTTCTIGFDAGAFDERADARLTAARYRTNHHEEVVDADEALIDRVAAIYGEPFADPSALPTLQVCGAARRHVKVALSGDGSDEIFAGYWRHPFFVGEERLRALMPASARRAFFRPLGALYPKLDFAPRPLRFKTTFQALGEDRPDAYARAIGMTLPERMENLFSGDFMQSTRDFDPARMVRDAAVDAPDDPLNFARRIDLATWLPGRMLTKIDRASMAHGLELRAPFLDHLLAEWVFALPPGHLLGAAGGKRILKAAQKNRIDHKILHARKRGFAPPVAEWLRQPESSLERFLTSDSWRACGIFDGGAVEDAVRRHRASAGDYSQELWTLIMFDAFLRHEREISA